MPKGHFPRSPEHRANIAKALTGRIMTPEWKAKMIASKTGTKMSDETRKKMSLAKKGKPNGRVFTEEEKDRFRAYRTGKTWKLQKYGVTAEEYERQLAEGNRWCMFRKHFAVNEGFRPNTPVCAGCKKEYQRKNNLKNMFGVDQAWYESKLEEQGGTCAICATTDPEVGKKFFGIDHCHINGHVRGLLCFRCNAALERVDNVAGWCAAATAYLIRYAAPQPPEVFDSADSVSKSTVDS